MRLAIQIVHYNTPELLKECLESVFAQQTDVAFDVKVLDNSPTDQLHAIRATWGQQVSFIFSKDNLGYGKGHNALMAAQTGDSTYTLLFNATCSFRRYDDLQRLIAFMEANPLCGAVGPQLVGKDGVRGIDHGELYGWRAWLFGLASYRLGKPHKKPTKVAWVSGAALIIRTPLLRVLQFDPDFFLYREEDMLQRLRNRGYQVWYVPTITVTHIAHASGSTYEDFMARSHRLFCEKHMSPFNPIPRIHEWIMVKLGFWKRGA